MELELTPEERFLEAAALLPQEPELVEAVTVELMEALVAVTEQMNALLSVEQLEALTAETAVDGVADATAKAALLTLRLNERVDELNQAAAANVDALIAALSATEALTLADKEQVNEGAAAYDVLLDAQKTMVNAENVLALEAAQALMIELIAREKAAEVDGLIAELPEAEAIGVNNYIEYVAPAEAARDAAMQLDEYERGFMIMSAKLDAVESKIVISKAASDVKKCSKRCPKARRRQPPN